MQADYQRAKQSQSGYLFMGRKEFQERAEVFGEDPFPIGLMKTRKNIVRAIQGSVAHGLLRKPLALDEIYFHTVLDT